MNSNYYRYKINQVPTDGYINIPFQITFDNLGREDGIREFEEKTLEDVINPISDFETTSFTHAPYGNLNETKISYEFYFYSGGSNSTVSSTTNSSQWGIDYQAADFTDSEIYYFSNSFKGSFFKLDFYDSKDTANQKIFFTVILPTQQGLLEDGYIGSLVNPLLVKVKKPKYVLDYVGADKEGFFIYWLKNQSYIDQTVFYMSAKFFNAKTGQFIRMMNTSQGELSQKFNFDKSLYFYYKCEFDYKTYEYKIYKETLPIGQTRVGIMTSPIKWYEYINP